MPGDVLKDRAAVDEEKQSFLCSSEDSTPLAHRPHLIMLSRLATSTVRATVVRQAAAVRNFSAAAVTTVSPER